MKTLDLLSAAQLYIALFWDGARPRRHGEALVVAAEPEILDLYRYDIKAHEPGLLTIIDLAAAVPPKAAHIMDRICAQYSNVNEMGLHPFQAFVDGSDILRNYAAKDVEAEACAHCGDGREHGKLRDRGVHAYVLLHDRCHADWAVVQQAIATAAMEALYPLEHPHTTFPELVAARLAALPKLGITLGEFGVARYHMMLERRLDIGSKRPDAILTSQAVRRERDAVAVVIRAKRGVTAEKAYLLANRGFHVGSAMEAAAKRAA